LLSPLLFLEEKGGKEREGKGGKGERKKKRRRKGGEEKGERAHPFSSSPSPLAFLFSPFPFSHPFPSTFRFKEFSKIG